MLSNIQFYPEMNIHFVIREDYSLCSKIPPQETVNMQLMM